VEGSGLFGLFPPGEGGDDVRARPILDGPADDLYHEEHLVLGELLGDPPGCLRGQSEELGGFLGGCAAVLVGHDPAVEKTRKSSPVMPEPLASMAMMRAKLNCPCRPPKA
jgi:hypothetical protein